jgi:hypothetical protein
MEQFRNEGSTREQDGGERSEGFDGFKDQKRRFADHKGSESEHGRTKPDRKEVGMSFGMKKATHLEDDGANSEDGPEARTDGTEREQTHEHGVYSTPTL